MKQQSGFSMGILGAWALALVALVAGGCTEREEAGPVSCSDGSTRTASTLGKASGSGRTEKATFGAGCFWGVEAAFRRLEGVTATAVGYAGGHFKNPTYEDVCSGRTGHAEVVRVVYDSVKVSYEELLEVFWSCHDPTTPERQGPDVGEQYRSVIFFHSPGQEAAARLSKEEQQNSGRFKGPIVTEIAPASEFHRAEEYHQQYLEKRGRVSCHPGLR